jgi:hypothetical protein
LPSLTNPGGNALFSQQNSQGVYVNQGLYQPNDTSLPEPTTLALLAVALLSMLGLTVLRSRKAA